MTPFTILFVDDDPGVLASLKRITRNSGYQSHFANSGREALERLESQPVHLVISDHKMPEMGGTELIVQVRSRFPHIIRVLFSGYADMKTLVDAINLGEVFRFIPKPWDLVEFHRIIEECQSEYDRRHREHLKAEVMELSPDPFLILQPETGIATYFNPSAARLLCGEKKLPDPEPISPGSSTLGWSLAQLAPERAPSDGKTWDHELEAHPWPFEGVQGRWTALNLRNYPGYHRVGYQWRADHRD